MVCTWLARLLPVHLSGRAKHMVTGYDRHADTANVALMSAGFLLMG